MVAMPRDPSELTPGRMCGMSATAPAYDKVGKLLAAVNGLSTPPAPAISLLGSVSSGIPSAYGLVHLVVDLRGADPVEHAVGLQYVHDLAALDSSQPDVDVVVAGKIDDLADRVRCLGVDEVDTLEVEHDRLDRRVGVGDELSPSVNRPVSGWSAAGAPSEGSSARLIGRRQPTLTGGERRLRLEPLPREGHGTAPPPPRRRVARGNGDGAD